jgi:hypothetical protein
VHVLSRFCGRRIIPSRISCIRTFVVVSCSPSKLFLRNLQQKNGWFWFLYLLSMTETVDTCTRTVSFSSFSIFSVEKLMGPMTLFFFINRTNNAHLVNEHNNSYCYVFLLNPYTLGDLNPDLLHLWRMRWPLRPAAKALLTNGLSGEPILLTRPIFVLCISTWKLTSKMSG